MTCVQWMGLQDADRLDMHETVLELSLLNYRDDLQ